MERLRKIITSTSKDNLNLIREDIDSANFLSTKDKQDIKKYFNRLYHFDIKTKNQLITFFGEDCRIDNGILRITNKLTGDIVLKIEGKATFLQRSYLKTSYNESV